MYKYYIRYHIVGNRVVLDVREFDSFDDAYMLTSHKMDEESILIEPEEGHAIEVKTEHITYFEVMDEEVYKKRQELNTLRGLAEINWN